MKEKDETTAVDRDYGLSREGHNAKERERDLREMREDPRYIAAVQRAEQARAQREAQEAARQRSLAKEREVKAQAELRAEKERQKRMWIASGNPAESFEEMWPELRRRVLLQNHDVQSQHYGSII